MGMTLEQLAAATGAQVRGDGGKTISGTGGLEDAGPEQLSFLANRRYARLLATTRAAAVVVRPADVEQAPAGLALLIADDPYFAFREAVVALHGFRPHPPPGRSADARIDPSATLGDDCVIQPYVVIERGARIGNRCVIYPHCYVGPNVTLGDDCILYPSVTVYDGCVLGDRVTLHAGCVVGQDGFGYATHGGAHHKIPQVGNVIIEDDVEMGANCAIDRATVGSTVISKGTKFSDLVAIGHGAKVGPHNLFVAQVGVAGSSETGRYVVLGGQVGVAGHLTIGDMVRIAAKSGVTGDLAGGDEYGGIPARPFSKTKRQWTAQAKLPELLHEVRALRKRVADLESRATDR